MYTIRWVALFQQESWENCGCELAATRRYSVAERVWRYVTEKTRAGIHYLFAKICPPLRVLNSRGVRYRENACVKPPQSPYCSISAECSPFAPRTE
jgi:hypothetical protein